MSLGEFFGARKGVHISAGLDFSMFVLKEKDGKEALYGCGNNSQGQVGVDITSKSLGIELIPSLSNQTIDYYELVPASF